MQKQAISYEKKVELLTRSQIITHLKTDYVLIDMVDFNKQTSELTNLESFVYLIMYKFRNTKTNIAFPSLETISIALSTESTTVPITSVSRAIKGLVAKKLIKSETVSGDSTNARKHYKFVAPLLEREGGFRDKIPYSLILNKSIEWQDRLFFIQLYPHIYSAENIIRYSKRQIAEKVGMNLKTVSERIDSLTELGILSRKDGKEAYKVNLSLALGLDEAELDWFIRKILDENHELREENDEIKKTATVLKSERDTLIEETERLKEENRKLKEDNKSLRQLIYELRARVAKLESEIRERNHVDRFAAQQAKNRLIEAHREAFDESEFEEEETTSKSTNKHDDIGTYRVKQESNWYIPKKREIDEDDEF